MLSILYDFIRDWRINIKIENYILEEYKALRAEILLCLERRITIISYGLAAIGVLFGAAITAADANIWLSIAVFLVLLPTTSIFVLNIWIAETYKVRRASQFNYHLERKLQEATDLEFPLEWETRLRDKNINKHRTVHYSKIAIYFTLIPALSIGIGVYFLLNQFQLFNYSTQIQIALSALVFIISFLALYFPKHRINQELIDEFNKIPDKLSLGTEKE